MSQPSAIAALAAGSLSFAKVHAHDVETLKRTEEALEKEISWETKSPPKGKIAKVRYHGERMLHSKHVLLAVVVLNIIDCILVMGELILDIHYIVDVLEKTEQVSDNFMTGLNTKYPNDLIGVYDIEDIYSKILLSSIQWNKTSDTIELQLVNYNNNDTNYELRHKRDLATENGLQPVQLIPVKTGLLFKSRRKRETTDHSQSNKKHKEHTIEEDIAHGFHKASITILAILVLETICKIFCFGLHILENKLEVFDSFIVFVSFTLDLVFIKGITIYAIQEFVFILAFLVPWRILRVVNSLIVAIIDHEHFRMKLLYMQKKQISNQMKEAKKELKSCEKRIAALEQLCLSAGVSEHQLQNCTGTENVTKSKKKRFGSSGSLRGLVVSFDNEESTPMMTWHKNNNGNSVTFIHPDKRSKSMDNLEDP